MLRITCSLYYRNARWFGSMMKIIEVDDVGGLRPDNQVAANRQRGCASSSVLRDLVKDQFASSAPSEQPSEGGGAAPALFALLHARV